jgi:hypothetical protein
MIGANDGSLDISDQAPGAVCPNCERFHLWSEHDCPRDCGVSDCFLPDHWIEPDEMRAPRSATFFTPPHDGLRRTP